MARRWDSGFAADFTDTRRGTGGLCPLMYCEIGKNRTANEHKRDYCRRDGPTGFFFCSGCMFWFPIECISPFSLFCCLLLICKGGDGGVWNGRGDGSVPLPAGMGE